MHIVLLLLGAIGFVVGAGLVAFGWPEAGFGNTLILAGSTALTGGLILIGLGSTVSHLRRIREAIEAQSVLRAVGPGSEIPTVSARQAAADASAQRDGGADSPIAGVLDAAGAAARAPASRTGSAPPIAPIAPADPGEPSHLDTPKPEWPRVDPADRVAAEPAAPAAPREAAEAGAAHPAQPESAVAADEQRLAHAAVAPPTVLKSGVIEGMAYTLYSDGSIDAELAHGTLRFNSIPELRAYLRENSG